MRVSDHEYITFNLVGDDDGHDCHLVASIAIERWIVALHIYSAVSGYMLGAILLLRMIISRASHFVGSALSH